MFGSLSTALSALSATSSAIDVVGNNLANLNTTGFKQNTVSFFEMMNTAGFNGLGESQIGFGVGRPLTFRQFSQGSIQNTSGALDVAIQGDGFLMVRNSLNATLYTRGGNLQVDKSGALLSPTGEKVLGWTQSAGVLQTSGPPGEITLPIGALKPPVPTTSFSVDLNLNAAATAGPPPTTFSTSLEVFDSLGASHIVTVGFTKTSNPNEWSYSISVPNADVTSPVTPVTGTLNFDSSGTLTNPPATGPFPALPITGLTNGAADLSVNWNIYNGQTARMTQYSQPSAVSANTQDGSPTAQLTKVSIGDGGTLLAQYSNGVQTIFGQLAMATIRNPNSLIAVGNNNFQLGARSADPAVGAPGTGGRGSISGGAIENSNVDIAREFTNLIILQRSYQANAKTVTTVDELSQETINLKR